MKSERSRRIAREKNERRRAGTLVGARAGQIVLLALVIITSLIFSREFISYLRKRTQLASMEADSASLGARLQQIRDEVERLQTDEAVIEMVIRERLHKTRDDEILIIPPPEHTEN